MTTRRDPLVGTTRVLIDATNLLHAVSQSAVPAPAATLVGRIRAAIPSPIQIELVFDGSPGRGMRGVRIASGLTVRHAAPLSADERLLALVDGARLAAGPAGVGEVLVVTDDRDLRLALQGRGARTAGSAWLLGRLDRGAGRPPTIANPRPPRAPSSAVDGGAGSDGGGGGSRGRGTTKRGNPRKAPKRRSP